MAQIISESLPEFVQGVSFISEGLGLGFLLVQWWELDSKYESDLSWEEFAGKKQGNTALDLFEGTGM